MNDNKYSGYFDDGEKLNSNLISKPDLCTTCGKDDEEEILCNLNRLDQAGEKEFICYAYESKYKEREIMIKKKMKGQTFEDRKMFLSFERIPVLESPPSRTCLWHGRQSGRLNKENGPTFIDP